MTLRALGYLADAWILGAYALLGARGNARPFHYANAIGAAPLLVAEVRAGLWQVVVLTGSFCAIGWVGLWTTRRTRVT